MARVYEMAEIQLKGEAPAGSQVEVDVMAEITGGGRTLKRKGFYAGNQTYKVRFLPDKAGIYHYKVTGIVTGEGTVEVEPADGKHHGIVRADGTHLRHQDGTFISTFGTTVYALAHQPEELTEETFASLEGGAFNKIRMCVFPKHYEYNKNEPAYHAFARAEDAEQLIFYDNLGGERSVQPFDTHRPDFDFWETFEAKLSRLFEMGIQVDLILFHPYDRWGHSHMTQEDNLRYLDYVLRRLAAYPNIWWSMANEYDLFYDWKIEQWHEIEAYISMNDPYRHLLSNHNCFLEYDYGREAVTHVSVQTRILSRVAELQKEFGKPVCYDECCYEGNLKETWGSISAKEMVNRFWKVTVTGGYCTHGEVILENDIVTKKQQDDAVLWWAKGGKLKGDSPARIKFLREIVESLPAPLDPYPTGLGKMALMSGEELSGMINALSEGQRGFFSVLGRMNEKEKLYHFLSEYTYAGHIGEEVYFYYLGTDCSARFCPEAAEGKSYRAEVINAWDMTREVVSEDYQMGDEIRLPGREYVAVLLCAQHSSISPDDSSERVTNG